MSVIRGAWGPKFFLSRGCGSDLRSVPKRWAARAFGGALLVATVWISYGAISPFFQRGPLAAPVKRADLVVSVVGNGTIESGKSFDIKCRVHGWSSILEIVPDGTYVRKGDLLLKLGENSLRDAIAAEKVALTSAQAAAIRAKKNCEAAKIAIDEYRNGTYVQQRLQLSRVISQAQQKLGSAESSRLQIEIMFRKAFVSEFHLQAAERVVEKAQSELAMAKNRRDILDEFTQVKMLADLTAKHAAAAAELSSAEGIVRTEAAKLERLQEDLSYCVIRAPQDGMVIYASRTARGQNSTNQPAPEIYQGARVRQFQTLLQLADLGRMQVRMVVPEHQLRQLRRGQQAYLKVLDQELQGEVAFIDDWPEAALPTDNGLKQFAVVIAIDGGREPLKPGMSAEVEIVVKRKQNTLMIPVICVIDEGSKSRVWVKQRRGAAPRKVMLGITNDTWIEVIDGLAEDEFVLLNPGR